MRLRPILLAAALVLAGCAGAGGELSTRAANDLQAHAAAVRQAAEAGDAEVAAAELEDLRGAVQHWIDRGQLDADRADEILAAAEEVESALALLPAPVETPEVEETEDLDEDEAEEDQDNSGPGSGDEGDGDGSSGPG